EGVSAVAVYRLLQTHRHLDGIQRKYNILLRNADLICDFLNCRLLHVLPDIPLLRINRFICGIPKRPAHPDRTVIPQISSDLTYDHGNCICGKLHQSCRIKMIHSLHKSYTADLEQIIRVFAASLKTFDHAEYKTQVSLDIFLSCFFVSGFDPFKKL